MHVPQMYLISKLLIFGQNHERDLNLKYFQEKEFSVDPDVNVNDFIDKQLKRKKEL